MHSPIFPGEAMIARLQQWLGITAIVFMILMMVSTVADVTGRWAFNSPINGSVELVRVLMVFAVFFTLGYAQLKKQHIRAELLVSRLSPAPKMLLDGFGLLLALGFAGLVSYGATKVAINSTLQFEYASGLINFPIWPARVALAVGCIGLALQYLAEFGGIFRKVSRQ